MLKDPEASRAPGSDDMIEFQKYLQNHVPVLNTGC